jgi:hypothetical protein
LSFVASDASNDANDALVVKHHLMQFVLPLDTQFEERAVSFFGSYETRTMERVQ